jgi:hypothetical protein
MPTGNVQMAIPFVGIQIEKRALLRKFYEPALKIYTKITKKES